MKRIFFLLFVLVSVLVKAQTVEIRNLPEYTGSLSASDYLIISLGGNNKNYKVSALSLSGGSGSDLLSLSNTWSEINIFSKGLRLSTTPSLAENYNISFNSSSEFGYTLNGAFVPLITKAEATELLSLSGGSGDPSLYPLKAGNNTYTGTNTFGNLTTFNGTVLFNNNGNFVLPYWASTASLPSYRIAYTIRGGRAVPMFRDGVNAASRLVDSIYLAQQTVGNYLPSTGTKSNANSVIRFTANGVRYVANSIAFSSTSVKAGIPYYETMPSSTTGFNIGDVFMASGLTDIDNLGNSYQRFSLYSVYQDFDHILQFAEYPDLTKVQREIKSKVNYTPYTIPASAIDVSLSYNVYQKTVSSETTFTFSNTTDKRIELWISNSGLSYIHFTAPSGYTIVYPDGFNQPFTGLHLYNIIIYNNKIFIRKDMTTSL